MKPYLLLALTLLLYTGVVKGQSTASSNVSTFTLHSSQLDVEKKIWIYLPNDYNAGKKKYPVIYMHDGQNVFDRSTSYAGEWRVDETLDSLKAEVIVVAIEHGGDKRMSELTPYSNEKYGGGDADIYLDFITGTLKPYVDENYRTKSDRKETAIAGSSLGGLVSYYALLRYPEVFGKAIVFSPSFWFSKEIYALTERTEKIDTKIYFISGDSEDKEMAPDMQRMFGLVLNKIKNKKHAFIKVVPGGKHNEALWAKEFPAAFVWLMQ